MSSGRSNSVSRQHTLKQRRPHHTKQHIQSSWSKQRTNLIPWFWTISHFVLTVATFTWTFQKYNGFHMMNTGVGAANDITNPSDIQSATAKLNLRPFVGIAKASAACINLQLGLILLPVTRSLVSAFRASFVNVVMPFDHAVGAHKIIAFYFCVFTIIHVLAHMMNYNAIIAIAKTNPMNMTKGFEKLPLIANSLAKNRPSGMDPALYLWLTTIPGWTGVLSVLFMFLAVTGALFHIRRHNFEIFYYSHHLLVLVFILIIPHGETGFVSSILGSDGNEKILSNGSGGDFKKSVLVGVLFYCVDRLLMRHLMRNPSPSKIVKCVRHPSNVMELCIMPPEQIGGSLVVHKSVPGSVIMINCPSISKHEYHPFTLTSCPSMGVWSVHIRCTGDWTTKFAKECGITFTNQDTSQSIESMPPLYIDGPFISECIDAIKHPVSVFIGAGIGVTPFAALLRDTLTRIQSGNTDVIIKKVYFFWICRDTHSFEWFIELLREFDGYYHLIEPYIYITNIDDPIQIMMNSKTSDSDLVTGLPFQSFFGRPNWDQLFTDMSKSHTEDSVGIFVCGPSQLSKAVRHATKPYTNMDFNEAQFE